MSKRDKFPTRNILLAGEMQRETARLVLDSAPLDRVHPLEVVIREQVKARKPDQNALMWSGPLADIAAQAYVNGRTYPDEVWHEFFKREYLPEAFDPEQCREGYRKWDIDPAGQRVLVGSTTQLTAYGFSLYLQQVEAYGANLGVMYHANPRMAA